MKFNQEIKHVIKDIKKELYVQNNKLMYGYNQKNIMTPYKLKVKNHFNTRPYLNDENIYKFNIMANSKILNINDIQQKNINRFFNTEKFEKSKRDSSIENLKLIINNKSPKYISDFYCNKNINKPGLKIYNYKSEKLHKIYETLT